MDDHWIFLISAFFQKEINKKDTAIAENLQKFRTGKWHVFGNGHDPFLCLIGSGMRYLKKIPLFKGSALTSEYIHTSSHDIAHG